MSEKRLYLAEAAITRLVVEVAPPLSPPVEPVALMPSGASSSRAPAVDLSAAATPEVTRRIDKPSILGRWWFWTAATAVVAGGMIGVAAAAGWLSPDSACPSGRRCM